MSRFTDYLRIARVPDFSAKASTAWNALVEQFASPSPPATEAPVGEFIEWGELSVKSRQTWAPKIEKRWALVRPKVATTLRLLQSCHRTLVRFPAKIAEYEAAGGQAAESYRANYQRLLSRYLVFGGYIFAGAKPRAEVPGSKLHFGRDVLTMDGVCFALAASRHILQLRLQIRNQAVDMAKKIKIMKKGKKASAASARNMKGRA